MSGTENVVMSDDAIVHPRRKCEHCLNCEDTSSTMDTADTAESVESVESVENGKEGEIGNEDNRKVDDETLYGRYGGYIASIISGVGIAVGCIVCHHIACPVVTLKAGSIGAKLAATKFVATKSTLHTFFARSAGGQCCCCSCGGCNGCCPCGTACCSCSC